MSGRGLEPGTTLGGYSILSRITAGSMGVLYLAKRKGPQGFNRPVAIKVIHDHLAADKRFSKLFIDEAKLSAQIDDPNVVRVEEFGRTEEGRYFIVMEYVDGVSLKEVLVRTEPIGGLAMDVAVAIATQIASGLHGAHEAVGDDGQPLGIVHRDVSPHNVLVSYRGHVRLIDFGIAKAKQNSGQTRTGSLRGKLSYMPPEQARSARTVDRRADIYSLGLVLWEMLARRKLFEGESEIAILNMIRNPNIVPPSTYRPEVPPALDRVVMQTLEQDPNQRPKTAADVMHLLGHAFPPSLHVTPHEIASVMARVKEAVPPPPPSSKRGARQKNEEITAPAPAGQTTAPTPGTTTAPAPVSARSVERTAPTPPSGDPIAPIEGIDDEPTTAVPERPVPIPPPPRPGEAARLPTPPPFSAPPISFAPPLPEVEPPVPPILRKIAERRRRKVELAVLLLVIIIAFPLTWAIISAR